MTQNQHSGNLHTALGHARRLLASSPGLAAEQATEILKVVPDSADAKHILALALHRSGNAAAAIDHLEPLVRQFPDQAPLLQELGMAYGAVGRSGDAITSLNKAVKANPTYLEAWRTLAELYSAVGDEEQSLRAYEAHLRASAQNPDTQRAVKLMADGNIPDAERLAREILKKDATDVTAIRVLADVALKLGRLDDAKNLLERCLELAPTFHLARHSYANTLLRRRDLTEALTECAKLLTAEPENPNFLMVKGSVLVQLGDHGPALALYEKLLGHYPDHPGAHMNYGHTLKTVGRTDEAVVAYRRCIELRPGTGEAYWSLANLKTFRFTDEDLAHMHANVTEEGGGDVEDQSHLAFALGKAYEDRGDFDQSFKYYARGNRIRRLNHPYDPRKNVYDSARQIKALTAAFFEERQGWGHDAPDPIFVVGLPRAGSTLIEQILSSHSLVEGTSELADIIVMSRMLGGKTKDNPASDYPEILTELPRDRFEELGKDYIRTTRVQRHGPPYFIDKMPNNFRHIGLIHTILPNAKIIDARRHPMAGCFAGFKQLFARGQTFSYGLEDIGHYYRDYVKVMDHWDEVLPGRVYRVQYEDMVADTEAEIRKLLDYCGLPFEEGCLRFYETRRAVRTPSSEQVRQPVYRDALELWRHYETHLDPLKKALGPLLERYPL